MGRTIAAALLTLLMASTATPEDAADPFREAADDVVPKLEKLVEWCRGKRMHRERACPSGR